MRPEGGPSLSVQPLAANTSKIGLREAELALCESEDMFLQRKMFS